MKKLLPFLLLAATPVFAADIFVAADKGDDTADGSAAHPLKTISAAADKAMPGDTVTVHAGTYRERVNPPRGGTDDAHRITYQAAKGEKVVITGSDAAKGWTRVEGDLWKLTVPNVSFGNFNPFADLIRGDWCRNPHRHHTGCVYLDGKWLREGDNLDQLKKPGREPLWFAQVDGDDGAVLMNLGKISPSGGPAIDGGAPSFRYGGKAAKAAGEPGTCSGGIRLGHWLRFDDVDFGAKSESIAFRASAPDHDTVVEWRLDSPEGELLGTCDVTKTGDRGKWAGFTAKIRPISGRHTLAVVFKTPAYAKGSTTVYAQFPGTDPNAANVEINRRPTVFYPSKNFVNWITVRGFTLENAACNWAPPSSEQTAVVGTNWSKGWIIEDNEIRNAKCSGVSLGKYGDGTDNTNDAGAADPYTACVRRALEKGWNKATVGSHIVRRNHIHHCEQTGIVGSMGCAFSVVEGNDIHDIDVRRLLSGAEQAGIKFHGFVDGVVRDNHLWRINGNSGLWLDWMAQGAQVAGNLFHDNSGGDIFSEMQHGPLLFANNLFLSNRPALKFNAKDMAVAHNLLIRNSRLFGDGRRTPTLKAHDTAIVALLSVGDWGNHRLYNNLTAVGWNGHAFDAGRKPSVADGNVYAKGARPGKTDTGATLAPDYDVAPKLTQKADGWYLSLREDAGWRTAAKRKLVTTALLGLAENTHCAYENTDGSPLVVDTDYFGKKRDASNPFPGPFETPVNGEVKVWPK